MGIPTIEYYDVPTDIECLRHPVSWTLEPPRAALLIHDMQNYFVGRFESDLFVEKLVSNVNCIRQRCHRLGIPTFYTVQPGGQAPESRGLLLDFWGAGMPAGHEQDIARGLEPVNEKDQVLIKRRYSAFAHSDLLERLKRERRNQLMICGVYAHIGCQVTATDAFMRDIKPFFVSDALGDFSRHHHELALRYVADCSGKVVSTSEVLRQLAHGPNAGILDRGLTQL